MMQVCRRGSREQIIHCDYFLLNTQHTEHWKIIQKMAIVLRVIIVHQVQRLHHANALSNYCHHKRMPTLYAGRCVVKKQQIINMFHFWMSTITMRLLFGMHKNSKLFSLFFFFPPTSALFTKQQKVSSQCSSYYQTFQLRGQRSSL